MKSLFQATALFPLLLSFVSASLIVPTPQTDTASSDIVFVAGTTGDDLVGFDFDLPYDADNGAPLSLSIHIPVADNECRSDPFYVNGVPIGLDHEYGLFEGPVTFPQLARHVKGSIETEAIFHLTCLKGQASFLSVRIVSLAGETISPAIAPGFTASFTHTIQPRILRLESTPQFSFDVEASEAFWLSPEPENEYVAKPAPKDSSLPSDTPEGQEAELLKIDALKAHFGSLKEELRKQEKTILAIWKSEFSNCSNLKCYFRTAIEKAPAYANLIATHFRHHHQFSLDFFKHGAHTNCSGSDTRLWKQTDGDAVDVKDDFVSVAADSVTAVYPVPTPHMPVVIAGPITGVYATPQEDSSTEPDMPPEQHHRRPPWAGGRRPPWAKPGSAPPWGHGPPPWVKSGEAPPWGNGPPPWVKSGDRPSWGNGPPPWVKSGGRPPWMKHHPSDSSSYNAQVVVPTMTAKQIWGFRLIGAMVGFLLVMFVAVCVSKTIRRKARNFCDPRTRAEMMAIREEWHTKRLYRKAACKHRFRALVGRLVGKISKAEEAEKEAMMAPQDNVVITGEIENIRAAHQFVGDMMRAEEGKSDFVVTAGHTLTRSESLPSYTSGPPGYTSEQEGDISVVDGFTASGYTPSNTDDTPDSESSVVDCSPRMSFETQRTA